MSRLSLLLFVFSFSALGATEKKISLVDAIHTALKQNQNMVAQRMQELQAKIDIDRINGEIGPHLEATVGVGPITKAIGNATGAYEDKNTWGRTFMGEFQFSQPLYMWGRSSNYKDAAHAGIRAKEEESKIKENELREQVKQAYYGIQYTASLLDFIETAKKNLDKAQERAEKKNSPKKNKYKLALMREEVNQREAEIRKNYELARAGLGLYLGEAGPVMPLENWISTQKRKLEALDQYVALANEHRPELRQLQDGIQAKYSLAMAEKKALLPLFGIIGSYNFAETNVRNKQPGVFAYDPYNNRRFSAGVGFKLDFQWGLQMAKASKYSAEAMELEAKQRYAQDGIPVDVQKAYWEVQEAETRLEAASSAYKTAKQWLTGEMAAYSAGLGKHEEFVDAYGARAKTVKDYYEAIYRHHTAWAALSRAVGKELEPGLD